MNVFESLRLSIPLAGAMASGSIPAATLYVLTSSDHIAIVAHTYELGHPPSDGTTPWQSWH